MKLIRCGAPGQEKPGLLLADGNRINLHSVFNDFDEHFFSSGGLDELKTLVDSGMDMLPRFDPEERLGSPVSRPSKIICIGLNYEAHAREGGMEIPEEPVVFFKSSSALCGPNDDLILPLNSQKTDWEVELAVVIGKRASYVEEPEAMSYIAGYVLHNDYSEREYQLERGGQWVKGKSFDRFAPLGPFMATPDEIPDPHNLNLWLKVNDEIFQQSNTRDFIFNLPKVISYLSRFMSLIPGDVISTGTPSGVGLGLKPPRYLKAGDVVELGIDGLGSSKQRILNWGDS